MMALQPPRKGELEVHDLQTRCVCDFFKFLGEGAEGFSILTTTRRIVNQQEEPIDCAVNIYPNYSCVDSPETTGSFIGDHDQRTIKLDQPTQAAYSVVYGRLSAHAAHCGKDFIVRSRQPLMV